jgi:protein PsiE
MINGIKVFEKIILVTVLVATIVAIGNEFMFMYSSKEVTLADLLLLFIYIEVVQMVREYWTLDRIRISIPLFIAITALARYIILQGKSGDPSFSTL